MDTVRAHSSGPEVDRGRWPNLGFFLSLGGEDMLREDGCRKRGVLKQFRQAGFRDLVMLSRALLCARVDAMKEHIAFREGANYQSIPLHQKIWGVK